MRKKKKPFSMLLEDLRRDLETFRSLRGGARIQFVWDYYRWRILACLFAIITVCTFAHMFWEGQRPCRLRVCVVLNTEDDCGQWFDAFTEKLQKDGKPGLVDINQDQPFDYDNQYYYVQELEVMTTVSSGRMDVAICGEDMYSYLLALNACLPLDQSLSEDLSNALSQQGRLVYDTANLKLDKNGQVNPADGIDGFYAADLTGTAFEQTYNQTEQADEPLYAVVISNTSHLEDCEALLWELLELSDN